MAYLYNYDWFITPYINGGTAILRDYNTELPSNQKKIVS
jgi:hypothetical protein